MPLSAPKPSPPFISLDDAPLHSRTLHDDQQFACTDPEYWNVIYDWRCPECVQHAAQDVLDNGDMLYYWSPASGAPELKLVTLNWLVRRSYELGVTRLPLKPSRSPERRPLYTTFR